MASRRIGRHFHRIRTKLTSCSLPSLEDLIISQKTLLNAIAKLRKNIHDMSTSLVEWSKLESNQAFYDVFTNRLTLDNVLCLLINDLHNQCTEFCSGFKIIKGKDKCIDLLRKKKDAKTTEVGRLRKKINTLKRVGVKRNVNDTSELELKKALADLDEITATLRTEINNFEITKARAIKDALTTYSQGWLKFSADSQNIFSAQYQIASEMSGKPERQHYTSMDVNQLIVSNTLQKMNLTIPELECPSPRRSKKGSLSRRTTRSLPVIPNNQDIFADCNEGEALPNEDFSNINKTPEKDQYPLVLEHDRVDLYEPVNIGTTTDLDDKDEGPRPKHHSVACTTCSSVSSLEDEGESSVESDEDNYYVMPNSYEDKGDENMSPKIRPTKRSSPTESVTVEQLLNITVLIPTVDDVYLHIIDPEYQDIEPATPPGNQSEIILQQQGEGSPSVRSGVDQYTFSQSNSNLHQPNTEHRKRLASRQVSTGSEISDESGLVSAQISQTDPGIVEVEKDNEIYAVYLPGKNCGECCKDAHEDQDKHEHCNVLDKSDSEEASGNCSQSIAHDSEISGSTGTTPARDIYEASHIDTYATYSPRHSSKASPKRPICQQKSRSLLHRTCSNTSSGSNSPDTPIKEVDSNSAPASSKQPDDETQNKVAKPPLMEKPAFLRRQPKPSQGKKNKETEE